MHVVNLRSQKPRLDESCRQQVWHVNFLAKQRGKHKYFVSFVCWPKVICKFLAARTLFISTSNKLACPQTLTHLDRDYGPYIGMYIQYAKSVPDCNNLFLELAIIGS